MKKRSKRFLLKAWEKIVIFCKWVEEHPGIDKVAVAAIRIIISILGYIK